jgi:hypothetical protein
LERIGRERRGLREDPHLQAKRWLSQIAEARRMRGGYQELAAKGLMTFEELGEKLAQLEADKATAERELVGLRNLQKTIEGLEKDRDVCYGPLPIWHRKPWTGWPRRRDTASIR